MVWLSGLMPFERAAEALERIGGIGTSRMSVWRQAQQTGQQFGLLEAQQRQQAAAPLSAQQPVPGEPRNRQRMGVAMDGVMIHLRGEDWKELKVGCVFEVEVRRRRHRGTHEWEEAGGAVHNSYTAHLGGPEVFGQQVWAEANRRHFTQAFDTLAIGDGAGWIWNLVGEHFFDSQQLVDWYHALQHLVLCAHLLHGEGTPACQQWLNLWEKALYQGHADRLAHHLVQQALHQSEELAAKLRREAGYFQDNHKRMNYQQMREDNWPIGSGMVESGGKQFKARFTAAGMHWSRSGAQNLIPVRSAILSRRFDDYWQAASRLPRN